MSLSRAALLREMGIGPLWRLRARAAAEPSTVAAGAEAAAAPAPSVLPEVAAPGAVLPRSAPEPEGRAQPVDDPVAAMDWTRLEAAIASCRACGLCQRRQQAVPGVGDRQADWLFIGEGPGAEEDARGEPFVGQAGKLLDAMLAALDLRRGEGVYIANAVKCRPPGNRTPEPAEMAACFPYLRRQIALIRPRVIVLLGRAAVFAVLGEEGALAGLRGRRHEYRDGDLVVPVIVTYHPAYLLRNLPDKAKAWEDLCLARATRRAAGLAGPQST